MHFGCGRFKVRMRCFFVIAEGTTPCAQCLRTRDVQQHRSKSSALPCTLADSQKKWSKACNARQRTCSKTPLLLCACMNWLNGCKDCPWHCFKTCVPGGPCTFRHRGEQPTCGRKSCTQRTGYYSRESEVLRCPVLLQTGTTWAQSVRTKHVSRREWPCSMRSPKKVSEGGRQRSLYWAASEITFL